MVLYDILRILPNGTRMSICDYGLQLGGFSTLELAVSGRTAVYDYFHQCGIRDELEVTPKLVAIVRDSVEEKTTADVNVWTSSTKTTSGDEGKN